MVLSVITNSKHFSAKTGKRPMAAEQKWTTEHYCFDFRRGAELSLLSVFPVR